MFKARYYKADGKKGKARALPDVIFDGVVNEGVMHQAVKAHLLNQRQGTGSAKNRSAVRGGSRKPWRQKGTGRARQGTIRAGQWEGGGVIFPPIPKSWRTSVPKKVRSLARRSALNDRAESDRVILADLPSMESPRTRDLVGFLATMELEGKTLVLTDGHNRNLYLSSRNVQDLEVLPFGDESAYDLLWATSVVIERSALDDAESGDAGKSAQKKKAAAAEKPPAKKKKAAAAEKPATKTKKAIKADKAEAAEPGTDQGDEAVTAEAEDSEAESPEEDDDA